MAFDDMNDINLAQNTILMGEAEYAAAINRIIASAKQHLLIFDQDFKIGEFTSIQRYELIHQFLKKDVTTKLTIILQDTNFFTTECPRLFDLLTTFSHKMTVYETNSHAKIAKDCFILADDTNYIRRFHIDQSRFKYAFDDKETTASLANRFEELLQETSYRISITKLGL